MNTTDQVSREGRQHATDPGEGGAGPEDRVTNTGWEYLRSVQVNYAERARDAALANK